MDGMFSIVIVVYTVWAVYSGFKVLSGRSEWLDRKAPINMVVKAVLSLVVGYFIAAFYLLYLIIKFIGAMSRM